MLDLNNYIYCNFNVYVIAKNCQIFMAKRQKIWRTIFYWNSQSNDIYVSIVGFTSSDCTSQYDYFTNYCELVKRCWCTQFSWIDFNAELEKIFHKIFRKRDGCTIFTNNGSINIHINVFQDHAKLEEHMRLMWARQCDERIMEREIAEAMWTCDKARHCFFKATYFIGK